MTMKFSALLLCAALMLVSLAQKQGQVFSEELPTAEATPGSRDANQLLYGVSEGSLHPQDCGPKCTDRCSATQYKKPCLFFCNKCCAKCLCVPPGTYGNKQVCPCYNNWKTKRGGPKCP